MPQSASSYAPRLPRRDLLRLGGVAAVATILSTSGAPLVAAADPFTAGRAAWLRSLVGTGAPGAYAAAARNAATGSADYYAQRYDDSSGVGLWADLDVFSANAQSWTMSATVGRLRLLALGAAMPDNPHAESLRQLAADGLAQVAERVFVPSRNRAGNWYDWDVATPLALNDVCLLLLTTLDPDVTSTLLTSARTITPTIPTEGTYGAAANKIAISDVFAGRGLLANESDDLAAAASAYRSCLPFADPNPKDFYSRDGFYPDGSFIQHGQFPYVGGYGQQFLKSAVAVSTKLAPTAYGVDAGPLLDRIELAYLPWMWRGRVLDPVRGRNTDQPEGGTAAAAGFVAGFLGLVGQLSTNARAGVLVGAIKAHLSDLPKSPWWLTPGQAEVLDAVNADAAAAVPAGLGTTVFGVMDRVVHRRPTWAAAVSMNSPRIANYETGTNQNLRGWYQADGAVTLANADVAQFDDGYWATIDSRRLPGVTVDTVPREAVAKPWAREAHNPLAFVGGLDCGSWGLAAMALEAESPSTLRARLSRVFFGNYFVCLGSGITVDAGRAAETTVENRRVTTVHTGQVVVDGTTIGAGLVTRTNPRWAHLDGTAGYVFLSPGALAVRQETRTGMLTDISGTATGVEATRLRSHRWSTLTLAYGRADAARHAYAVLPDATPTATAAYAARPPVRIVRLDASAHVVTEAATRRTLAVFFRPGSTSFLTAVTPCAVGMVESAGVLKLGVSDPTQTAQSVELTLTGRVAGVIRSDAGVVVRRGKTKTTVQVNTAGARGRTFGVALNWQQR